MNQEKLIAQLKIDEGFRGKPYRCTAGKLTIGFGRNLDDVGVSVAEAEMMLSEDLKEAVPQLEALPHYRMLNDVRQNVLCNMAFNLGIPRLMMFKNMWSALAHRNYETAAAEMLNSRWARQVGERAERLAKEMRTGEF
ncbi:glycoside hydrolase family protein [uncultured Amphritea sp.]|uniref:glycoside hydrolase family protein n=1 Tax=uncultured Amphritea sp. TaxID=981605 RepID=UPI0025FA72F9|nr:glycoside hydrolase family protein [uncultured Amphritea sp.]